MSRNTQAFTDYTDDGDEVEVHLPVKMEVCGDCEGFGSVLNPSMRSHAYTQEEFDEAFSDEDREQYFTRGGIYDVQCPTCHGRNVVPEVDEDRLTAKQKVIYARIRRRREDDARDDAADAAIRRMESGGYG